MPRRKRKSDGGKMREEQEDLGSIKREIGYKGTAADLDATDDDERYSDKAAGSLANGVQVCAKERENESATRESRRNPA